MVGLTVDADGRVFSIDKRGMPESRSRGFVPLPSTDKIAILVNGFDYDPTQKNSDNPHQTLFKNWSDNIRTYASEDWQCFGFGWYSAELEPLSLLSGISRGHWNPYRWAWELAGKAGGILANIIDSRRNDSPCEICIVAHSLGARVVLSALRQLDPITVDRVLLLNGSEYSQTAKVIATYTRSHVLNVVVKADDVLGKLGTLFAPEAFIRAVVGQSGISNPPQTWLDINLDDSHVQSLVAEYNDLRGDNPNGIADHWFTYTHLPNWLLFGDFLAARKSLDDLRRVLSSEDG